MKKAILILADGTTVTLEGSFVLLTELADCRELGVVRTFRDGKLQNDIVCDSCVDALDCIREIRRRL